MESQTPDFITTNLFERICWAHENLNPVEPEYCIVYEDNLDETVKVTHPSPQWMAMAIHGGLLPPISAYEKVEYGCWISKLSNIKLWTKLNYARAAKQTLDERIAYLSNDSESEEYLDLTMTALEKLKEINELTSQIYQSDAPSAIFRGLEGEKQAQQYCKEHDGVYRIINYDVVHMAKPIGPMTQEEAIEYMLQKDVPFSVWNPDNQLNRNKYKITKRINIPKDRTFRNAWALEQKEEEYV